jgi:hypothetical protein
MKWILWLTFSLVPLFSEYRVYELRITNKKTNKSRTVYSTLDWIQYTDYHHLARDERIEMVDHWMCWKRSEGFNPLCKRPVTADTLKSENQEPEG